MEAGDAQKFADSLAEFDSMTRLDAWKTSLLLKVTSVAQRYQVHEGNYREGRGVCRHCCLR